MQFQFKHFAELTGDELYDILQLRAEVFVVEQDCVYNDLDGRDKEAVHQFLKIDGQIVACSRLLKPGSRFSEYSIGRVVVKETARGSGLGKQMMLEAQNYIQTVWETGQIRISAQKYLLKFYEDLGFQKASDEYLEDGIPHFEMIFKATL